MELATRSPTTTLLASHVGPDRLLKLDNLRYGEQLRRPSHISGTTTYTRSYGVTGYSTPLGSATSYFRFIVLDAYDLDVYKRENKLDQVWRSTVTSTGSSGDLRHVFPVMVAGSAKHLATNTGQKVEITLDEENATVRYIKGTPQR